MNASQKPSPLTLPPLLDARHGLLPNDIALKVVAPASKILAHAGEDDDNCKKLGAKNKCILNGLKGGKKKINK